MTQADRRDCRLRALLWAIAAGQGMAVAKMLTTTPGLARERAADGATRRVAQAHYLHEIGHYVYAGDTALHIAAAAYQKEIVERLIGHGADVRAKNRRGAEPLHYAADGIGFARMGPAGASGDYRLPSRGGCRPKRVGQQRRHPFAPSGAFALRRCRQGTARRWRR